MLAVWQLPKRVNLALIESQVRTRPASLWGEAVQWPSDESPPLVYISQFKVPAKGRRDEVYLLGMRHDLAGAIVNGKPQGSGYVIEFFVATVDMRQQWQVHRLRQRGTTAFSAEYEKGDDFPADEIENPAKLSLYSAPKWKPTNIEWPTLREQPMKFVGQVSLPETVVTHKHLTADDNVYLFWLPLNGRDHFKITVQPTTLQTADEHYAEEEARWKAEGWDPEDE